MSPHKEAFGESHEAVYTEIVEMIPAMRAFARTFYRNKDNADDLVQDTLLKGLAKAHQFTPGTNLKSWLFTIMRNTFYTRIVRENREAPGAVDCISAKPKVDATQEWSVRGQEIYGALQRLPEAQRKIVILIAVFGVSYEETAQICGCAMGTVKSRLNRARSRLLAELGEENAQQSVQQMSRHPVLHTMAL